jgi:hypothetical protein
MMYLLNDVVDHSILTGKPNLETASAALELAKISRSKKTGFRKHSSDSRTKHRRLYRRQLFAFGQDKAAGSD